MTYAQMIVRLREASRLARAAAEVARTVFDGIPEEDQTATTGAVAETAAIHLGIFSQDLETEAAALERELGGADPSPLSLEEARRLDLGERPA